MAHIDDMTGRMPQLYRDGELLRGVLMQPAIQLEILDELGRTIAQSHWFDAAWEREDVVRLARLLDIEAQPWQDADEFRAWVHSLRNAWLRHSGSVTVAGLQSFVREYVERYSRAVAISAVPPLTLWTDSPDPSAAAFIENPGLKRILPAGPAALQPLTLFAVTNRGLDPVPLRFLLQNVSGAPEYVPLIANITTGQALLYKGTIAQGERLWIDSDGNGTATAAIEDREVSDRLVSLADFSPGIPFEGSAIASPAQAMILNRGENQLWFFPCALFDEQGLDRYLSALAALKITQGAFDSSLFDSSLFSQDALVRMFVAYEEAQPASFSIELPGGLMLSEAGQFEEALEKREALATSLQDGVDKLKAAGVQGNITLLELQEVQFQRDYLKDSTPKRFSSAGPTGTDGEPAIGAVFEKTGLNYSIFH
ncbi:MAG: hypothetical protein RBR16_04250 [Syntrophus sp. (in: bacteria)]|nr:hypothetical protein [Syntrophus sp. (in: bacteria)]